jgi:hypothetical protein
MDSLYSAPLPGEDPDRVPDEVVAEEMDIFASAQAALTGRVG